MSLEKIVSERLNRLDFTIDKALNNRIINYIKNPIGKACRPILPIANSLCDIFDGLLENFEGRKANNLLKYTAGLAVTSPLYLYLHEGMHSLGARLVGGVNYSIGMSKYFGGEIINKILPWITTNVQEGDFLGRSHNDYPLNMTHAQASFVDLLPYTLTIPGYIMLQKGIKEKKYFLTAAGTAFLFPTIANTLTSIFKDTDISTASQNLFSNETTSTIMTFLIAAGILHASKKISDWYNNLKPSKIRTGIIGLTSAAFICGLTALIAPQETREERQQRADKAQNNLIQTYRDYNKYLNELERISKEFPEKDFSSLKKLYPEVAFYHLATNFQGEELIKEAKKMLRGTIRWTKAEVAMKLLDSNIIQDYQLIDELMKEAEPRPDEALYMQLDKMGMNTMAYFLKKHRSSPHHDDVKNKFIKDYCEYYADLPPELRISAINKLSNLPFTIRKELMQIINYGELPK